MDAAVLRDRLPEVTQKPFQGPGSLSLQFRHSESSRVLAGLAFFVRCCHSTHRLLFMGFSRGRREVSSSLRPKPSTSINFREFLGNFCIVHFIKESMLIRLPLPQGFWPRGRKLRPWSEKNSDQNPDHPRLCIYQGKEKLRPWSEFLGRENSDHGLSLPCFWGRGRRGGSQRTLAKLFRVVLGDFRC